MKPSSAQIRQETTIRRTTQEERQHTTLEAIRELEEMLKRGDIEKPAYFIKKRALIKLL